ncbi:ARID DNA-binding domain-containing protein [Tanacetum coccineum]|uniref:ARID DNA-binding domain-containing protein n=1 Tax=Tanacetum coccineum TaxID=301880 RepID=A0ABQ5A158_9ASTR
MQKANSTSGKWQRPMKYSYGLHNKWHQSKFLGRPPRRFVHTEFVQRQNKRDREERLGRCIREITRDCRDMLRKKLIVKGTYEGTWDDYWYVSASTNKHLTSNLNFFVNIKEEFLVEKIEGQKKFLFTYGIGEVLIKNGSNTYLIPGVHYALETTLNILSINLLRQQGFELIFEEEKCSLEYMFKTKQGKNLDVDRMKQMHNNYLDDYFESLDKERIDREEGKARPLEATEQPEVHNFHGFVDFLNLIKKDEIVSREWDAYRSRFDKVLKCVHFGLEFGALAETLGLTRSDGEKIRKCYETYLEVFVSYYKTARAPENPIRIGEDSESLDEYQWKIDEKVAPEAVGKGKEKLEHFGIKLEEEEACKPQQTAHYGKEESQIKCYKCQDLGHYAFECPLKNKRKDQNKVSSYKASTSNLAEGMDSNSTSSDDYLIIT